MKHLRLLGIATLLAACTAPANENPARPGANHGTSVEPTEATDVPSAPEPPSEPPPATESPETGAPGDDGGSSPTIPSGVMPFRGVNLDGAQFGSALPGKDGTDYTFPTRAEVDYFVGKGMTTFRMGFRWERMQQQAKGDFDAPYTSKYEAIVKYATSKGAYVILNPHNFARYYGEVVGGEKVPNEVFADFWGRLAARFKDEPRVLFNLVNEPHTMPTEQWVSAANAAIAAIRQSGATQTIVVPGNSWTGASTWKKGTYGTPNAVAMLQIADPKDNVLFEVHQYLDTDASGSSAECVSTTVGKDRLVPFVEWLRENGKKGILGEFAGGDNETCNAAVKGMLDYVHASSDVMVGWLWWSAGPWWNDYIYSIEPRENGQDRPPMALLTPYLKR